MGSSHMLGPEHPLSRADSRLRTMRAQLAVTVVLGSAMLASSPLLGPSALHLVVGAGVVAGLLVVGMLFARASQREQALELIASGREELPLPVVESERSRLSDRRYRRRLARTLDAIRVDPTPKEWWSPVYADREAVREARDELTEVARLLRELPHVRARGVALVTRLIRDGATSPLYRGPGPQLREELGRIRHVLIER